MCNNAFQISLWDYGLSSNKVIFYVWGRQKEKCYLSVILFDVALRRCFICISICLTLVTQITCMLSFCTISMINAFIEFVGIDTRIDINIGSNVSFWGNIFSISPIDIHLHIEWLSFVSSLLNKTKEIPSSGYQTFNLAQEHDVKWCSSFTSKTFLTHIKASYNGISFIK